MGSPQTLKSSAHAKPLTHLKPKAEAGRGGQGTRDASGLQAGSGKWRKRSPQTPPPRSLGTPRCPLNTAPLRGPQAGLWKSPAHPLPGKFSGVTRAPLRLHLPSSAQGRERGQRTGGATSRDLPVAERRPTGSSPGHPRGAQTGGGGGGGRKGTVTGVQGSGSRRVQSSAAPGPCPRPSLGISEA